MVLGYYRDVFAMFDEIGLKELKWARIEACKNKSVGSVLFTSLIVRAREYKQRKFLFRDCGQSFACLEHFDPMRRMAYIEISYIISRYICGSD